MLENNERFFFFFKISVFFVHETAFQNKNYFYYDALC